MKCGYGFKMGYGFKGGGSGGLLITPTSTNWQQYRRKEPNASYGTVTFQADRIAMVVNKASGSLTSTQTGVFSKFKISTSDYTKLAITYIALTTSAIEYFNQIYFSDKMLTNYPDYNSTTNWYDRDELTASGAVISQVVYPNLSSVAIKVEYDISLITGAKYLYVGNWYNNTGTNNGIGELYIYNVELR